MKGTVLGFDEMNRKGVISGEDDNRYELKVEHWKGNILPKPGMSVDFVVAENNLATEIYLVTTAVATTGNTTKLSNNLTKTSKKVPAALLAFFFGSFGVHKFYLGYTNAGIVMLLVYIFGFLLIVPPFIIWLISIIEFIIYIIKTDEEFDEIYVQNERTWF